MFVDIVYSSAAQVVTFANMLGELYVLDGIEYGESSYGAKLVLNDPYVNSPSRIFIAVAISMVTIYVALKIVSFYTRKGPRLVIGVMTPERKLHFTILACLSLIVSAIHHIDNFVRITQYFMTTALYHGIFFILDMGLYYWLTTAAMLLYGCSVLMSDRQVLPRERVLAMYALHVHCVMIWVSPLLHYSVERIALFPLSANISILSEGTCSVLFHLYVIYLSCMASAQASEVMRGYSPVPTVEMMSKTCLDCELPGDVENRRD